MRRNSYSSAVQGIVLFIALLGAAFVGAGIYRAYMIGPESVVGGYSPLIGYNGPYSSGYLGVSGYPSYAWYAPFYEDPYYQPYFASHNLPRPVASNRTTITTVVVSHPSPPINPAKSAPTGPRGGPQSAPGQKAAPNANPPQSAPPKPSGGQRTAPTSGSSVPPAPPKPAGGSRQAPPPAPRKPGR